MIDKQGSSGIAPNIASLLCYLFLPITVFLPVISVIFLLIEKEDLDVRFHAWQATIFGCGFLALLIALKISSAIMGAIASLFGIIIGFFIPILLIAAFIIWGISIVKAYQGERWRIPVVGDIAAKKVGVS